MNNFEGNHDLDAKAKLEADLISGEAVFVPEEEARDVADRFRHFYSTEDGFDSYGNLAEFINELKKEKPYLQDSSIYHMLVGSSIHGETRGFIDIADVVEKYTDEDGTEKERVIRPRSMLNFVRKELTQSKDPFK